MRAAEQFIAKKYAQALLNLYFVEMKPDCFMTLLALRDFFERNIRVVRYLCIPTIPDSIKGQILDKVFESLQVCSMVKKLVVPLMKQRRIDLLDQVIIRLIERYQKKIGMVEFDVLTSHQISDKEQNNIISFLSKETGAKVSATFCVDGTLIAGFRAQSKTFLFEHSLLKKIRDAKTSFYQRIEP